MVYVIPIKGFRSCIHFVHSHAIATPIELTNSHSYLLKAALGLSVPADYPSGRSNLITLPSPSGRIYIISSIARISTSLFHFAFIPTRGVHGTEF